MTLPLPKLAPRAFRAVRLRRTMASSAFQRVRHYLDRNVFLDPPAASPFTLRRALLYAGLAFGGVVILIARMWSSVPLNTIWAEDGMTMLPDAMGRGFFDVLTLPYNGYLETVPRLVAEPVSALPVEWFAPAMAISGAAIVTGCALVVWRASEAYIASPHLRGALAAMVLLLPVANVEMLDNVTNSIWYLLFAAFWILLWRPTTFATAVAAACVLFLAAVSNGGIVVLIPLWLLRLAALRDRRDGVIVVAFAVGVAAQVGLSWGQTDLIGEEGARPPAFAQAYFYSHWDWGLVPAYAQRIVGAALGGQRINGFLWENLGVPFEVLLAALLVAFLAWALAGTEPWARVLVPLTVAISTAFFLLSGYARWSFAGLFFHWPEGTSNTVGARYLIVPTLLLLSALFIQLDAGVRSLSWSAAERLRAGAAVFVVVIALLTFNVADKVRGTPTWTQALDASRPKCIGREAAKVDVPIAPQAFGSSSLPLPCRKLEGD
jgi:hypothetical protein